MPPHIALLASAGMGHLIPITRLATTLLSVDENISVTIISTESTVSISESDHLSNFFSSHPQINSLTLPLNDLENPPPNADPFFLRFEALSRSADNLLSLLSQNNTFSAIVIDITLASAYVPVVNSAGLRCYVLFTSSAAMLSLLAYYPTKSSPCSRDIEIPGLWTIETTSLPPPLRDPNHLFAKQFVANGKAIAECAGIIANTFSSFEPEALSALALARDEIGLPVTMAVGPLQPFSQLSTKNGYIGEWLDGQPDRSVVYVSFGSRTGMTEGQIRELASGLEKSGCRFLWTLKTKIVDRDESGGEMGKLLGEGYLERVKGRGLVVNEWVDQEMVLGHVAIGGFVSHLGWNSVTEAAMAGVRVLGWPRLGDQRVNGMVVRKGGIGVWMEEWSWEAEKVVVAGEEIGRRVREMMENEELRKSAEKVGEEAAKAVKVGGSSYQSLKQLISSLPS